MRKLCVYIILFLLRKFSFSFYSLTENSCFWRIRENEEDDTAFRIDCGFYLVLTTIPMEDIYNTIIDFRIPTRKYEFFLVLFFATDEINRNPFILPNMTLYFTLYDSLCSSPLETVDSMYLQDDPGRTFSNYDCNDVQCDVYLLGPSWTISSKISINNIFPTIFFGPFHPIFRDKVLFPNNYQIAHRDTCLPQAMVSLMLYFSWTWIGLVMSNDDKGIQFLLGMREEMHRNGVCIAFVNVIPESIHLYMERAVLYDEQIITSSTKVVIIYGEINSTLEISHRRWEYLVGQRIWITTSQWDAITSKRDFSLDTLYGTVSFEQHHRKVSKFGDFLQIMNTSKYPADLSQMRTKWNHFNCSVSKTNYSEMNHSLNTISKWLSQHRFDMGLSEEGYNLYNAVYAVAPTYHDIIHHQIDFHYFFHHVIFVDCHQMDTFLKKRVFINPVGDLVDMNLREKLCAEYDIYNILNFLQDIALKMKIGRYSSYFPQNHQLHISEYFPWAIGTTLVPTSSCSVTCPSGFRKFHQEQTAVCCFDCAWCPENEISNETDMEHCVSCPDDQYSNAEHTYCLQKHMNFLSYEDPIGMTLAFMSLCFSTLTALVLGVFVKYNDTPIVKANNYVLSYILLISLIFCFFCPLFFIGNPNIITCILQKTIFGVFFTVAVSTILAKTITVVLTFKLTNPGRKMRGILISQAPKFIIPVCTLIQFILCGIWLATSPPFIDTDTYSEHGQIIIVCNKGSVIAFYFVLGYLGFLAMGSFSVAFLGRNLPERFNEAKFLTFSMLVFCSVWVTFLPVYHSTKGKVMVAMEGFTILVSSAGLLSCIFFPKCYVILIRPDLNILQTYRGKSLH